MILYIIKWAFFEDFRSLFWQYTFVMMINRICPRASSHKKPLGMISDRYQSSPAHITGVHPYDIQNTQKMCPPPLKRIKT